MLYYLQTFFTVHHYILSMYISEKMKKMQIIKRKKLSSI